MNVQKGMLYASCRTVSGNWKEASLALGNCRYPVYNANGALACTVPYGSYQHSCRNIRVADTQLTAECKTRSGAWTGTSTALACGRDLAHIDGARRCM